MGDKLFSRQRQLVRHDSQDGYCLFQQVRHEHVENKNPVHPVNPVRLL
jgi:hypothetical protein